MKSKFLLAAMATCVFAQAAFADVDAKLLKELEPKVDKAMAGYNAKNWKAFYGAGWADQVKALQTEQVFTSLYTNNYIKNYGTLKSKTLNQPKSVMSDMNGLLDYDAVFSNKKGHLQINFFKEGGVWKIQQLQVNP